MIAYLFWHTAAAGGHDAAYEGALAEFHAALAREQPVGFRASAAARVEVPWLARPGYEDWYLVDGWAALGQLEQAAVDARRRGVHDRVAVAAAAGEGAVYGLAGGSPGLDARTAAWLDKPRGVPYDGFRERLSAAGSGAWERRLVLGRAPEFCVLDRVELPAGALRVEREPVFP